MGSSPFKVVCNKPFKMTFNLLFISIYIIICVSYIEATNSCLVKWLSMKAYTAEGNELKNKTIKITLHVEGLDDDYQGKYSFTMPFAVDEEDDNIYKFDFKMVNGNKCIWKANTSTWWIGNCDQIGESKGFAYTKDCQCPWPSKNEDEYDYYYNEDYQPCKQCTWTKYSNDENFSCNPEMVDECELGVGFLGRIWYI